jgi:long-chain acyl-CoA synthetase
MVLGEGKPYLSALLVLNANQWQSFCDSLGVDLSSAKALTDESVQAAVLKRVSEQIKIFPGYAQIQRAALLLEPWSIENGLITPTLKLKRQQIMDQYADTISNLYAGHISPNGIKPKAHAHRKQQTA